MFDSKSGVIRIQKSVYDAASPGDDTESWLIRSGQEEVIEEKVYEPGILMQLSGFRPLFNSFNRAESLS